MTAITAGEAVWNRPGWLRESLQANAVHLTKDERIATEIAAALPDSCLRTLALGGYIASAGSATDPRAAVTGIMWDHLAMSMDAGRVSLPRQHRAALQVAASLASGHLIHLGSTLSSLEPQMRERVMTALATNPKGR